MIINNYFKHLCGFFIGQILATIMMNDSHLATFLRSKLYKTDTEIKTSVVIKNKGNYKGGLDSTLYHGVEILNQNGIVSIGRNSHLGSYCLVNAVEGQVKIGKNVAVGPGCKIISYSNHYKSGKLVTNEKIQKNIIIGDNVFIGANSTILPGTTIGDNTIIGANSLIKGDIQGNSIYAGSPCKKITEGWHH